MAGSMPCRPVATTDGRTGGPGEVVDYVRLHRLRPVAAQVVVGRVDGDAMQPGAEPRLAFEGVEVLEGLDEGLLRDVGRIPGIAQRA